MVPRWSPHLPQSADEGDATDGPAAKLLSQIGSHSPVSTHALPC